MAGPLTIQCPGCQGRFKVKSQAAIGKKVACPKCDHRFVVKPPKKKSRPVPTADADDIEDYDEFDDIEDFDDFDQGDADFGSSPGLPPVRSSGRGGKSGKKKRSRRGNAAALKFAKVGGLAVVVIAVLAGAGYGIMLLVPALMGFGGSIDFTYLPPDTERVSVHRYADMWNSSRVQSWLDLDPGIAGQVEAMRNATGLGPEHIESLTTGSSTGENRQQIAVLRTSAPMDPAKLMALVEGHETTEHQGVSYYRAGAEAIWFPDAMTMVRGDETSLQQAIERGAMAPEMPQFDFVDAGHHNVSAYVPRDVSVFENSNPITHLGVPIPIQHRESRDSPPEFSGTLRAYASGSSYSSGRSGTRQVLFADPETAKEVEKRADRTLHLAKKAAAIRVDQIHLTNEQLRFFEPYGKPKSEQEQKQAEHRRERQAETVTLAYKSAKSAGASRSGNAVRISTWSPAQSKPTEEEKQDERYRAPRVPLQVSAMLQTIGVPFSAVEMPQRTPDPSRRPTSPLPTQIPGQPGEPPGGAGNDGGAGF